MRRAHIILLWLLYTNKKEEKLASDSQPGIQANYYQDWLNKIGTKFELGSEEKRNHA